MSNSEQVCSTKTRLKNSLKEHAGPHLIVKINLL